jgi:hypothetical protein
MERENMEGKNKMTSKSKIETIWEADDKSGCFVRETKEDEGYLPLTFYYLKFNELRDGQVVLRDIMIPNELVEAIRRMKSEKK